MLEKIKEIICDYANVAPETITEDTNVHTDLGLDSLSLVNLAVAVENEFDLEIPDREVAGIETVADIISLIEEYTNAD